MSEPVNKWMGVKMSEKLPACALCGMPPITTGGLITCSEASCDLRGVFNFWQWTQLMARPTLAELEQDAWHPVSEKITGIPRDILGIDTMGYMFVRTMWEGRDFETCETHWRELPSPPTGPKEES